MASSPFSTPPRNDAGASSSDEAEEIQLLRALFPESSTPELYQFHEDRLESAKKKRLREQQEAETLDMLVAEAEQQSGNSHLAVARRLEWGQEQQPQHAETAVTWKTLRSRERTKAPVQVLPGDFLRIPRDVALQVKDETTGQKKWVVFIELEKTILEEHINIDAFSILEGDIFTKAVNRNESVGIGMTVKEGNGSIWIHSVVGCDSTLVQSAHGGNTAAPMGPAGQQGLRPGDRILGVNGVPFLKNHLPGKATAAFEKASSRDILHAAVRFIQRTPDPVLLTVHRLPRLSQIPRNKVERVNQPSLATGSQSQYPARPMTTEASLTNRAYTAVDAKDLPTSQSQTYNNDIFESAAQTESNALSPPRSHPGEFESAIPPKMGATLRTNSCPDIFKSDSQRKPSKHASKKEVLHQFAEALASRQLIESHEEKLKVTKNLDQYTSRTRQWESTSSFRLDASTNRLVPHFDPRDLAVSEAADTLPFEYENTKSLRPYAPSTPTIHPTDALEENTFESEEDLTSSFHGLLGRSSNSIQRGGSRSPPRYPGRMRRAALNRDDVVVPLFGVRKALSIRIVNTFLERSKTAFTIWVYDVETGKEWYAPVRYYSDFKDLRTATAQLSTKAAQIPFPNPGWGVFSGLSGKESESKSAKLQRCKQLEHFLRALSGMIYTDDLHPNIAMIAIHLQSFLGCDAGLDDADELDMQLLMESTFRENADAALDRNRENVRLLLKRSIQRYIYRLFLLPTMARIVNHFLDLARVDKPAAADAGGSRSSMKDAALEDMLKLQDFMDQLQELILDGCMDDLVSISERRDFVALRVMMEGEKGKTFRERLFREAVREQIETEVYVPLRSTISKKLVEGWKHDDMEMNFKVVELLKRPQSTFKIPPDIQSPSGWSSASRVLSHGVGKKTLPCAKLRAIVESAKEISKVYEEEHSENDGKTATLGADDFLPIFIYCVVRAKIERPCALCVLLRTLCDPQQRIGEVGYYLASFEAAIAHIQELDLSATNQLEDLFPSLLSIER